MYGHIGQKETLRRHGENKRQGHKIGIDCVALPFLARLLLSQEREGGSGTPDIVLRKYGIVIFIYGCFGHGHEVDGTMPKTNCEFWKNKIERNRQRDERNKEALKQMGWRVMIVWECQLKPAVRQQTLLEIEYHINHTYLEKFKPKAPRLYNIGEHEKAPDMVADGKVEYGIQRSKLSI